MLPRFSRYNFFDIGLVAREPFCQPSIAEETSNKRFPNFQYLCDGKLCGVLRLTSIGPALYNHVRQVLGTSSSPKMRRINAGFIVAGMTDQIPSWNRPDVHHVGNTVSHDKFTIKTEYTIPRKVLASLPIPTPVCLFNLAPKVRRLFWIQLEKCYSGFSNFSIHTIDFVSVVGARQTFPRHG
jgi:hypothetical protein